VKEANLSLNTWILILGLSVWKKEGIVTAVGEATNSDYHKLLQLISLPSRGNNKVAKRFFKLLPFQFLLDCLRFP
jgi:hypothetical protein